MCWAVALAAREKQSVLRSADQRLSVSLGPDLASDQADLSSERLPKNRLSVTQRLPSTGERVAAIQMLRARLEPESAVELHLELEPNFGRNRSSLSATLGCEDEQSVASDSAAELQLHAAATSVHSLVEVQPGVSEEILDREEIA